MDVDLIFREASSVSKYWRLEGFCTDTSRTILLTPLGPSTCIALPPYHLLCVLNEHDPCYQDLVDVADNPGSKLPESRIRFIAKTVVELLDAWASSRNFRETIHEIAMGSRIHIDEVMPSIISKIWLSPNLELEKRYISLGQLRRLWVDLALDLPPTLDFENLAAISRLHDSTSKVQLPNGEVAVFKGAVRIVARMYHELRELIRMPDHVNILSKPKYVVTRKTSGMPEGVVCGFIVEYHSGGSLLNALASSTPQQPIPMDTKIKWIRQLISALQHIHGPAGSFYSDLRLDNIVLSQERDVILIDFEQYGSPQRWLHPSLWDKPSGHQVLPNQGWMKSPINPVSMPRGIVYSNPALGYYKTFSDATEEQRQTFENYALAKVMWCIFEEETNQVSCFGINDENAHMLRDDGRELHETVFPRFFKTPSRMRYWIWACTRSSKEWGDAHCACTPHEPEVCGRSGAMFQPTTLRGIGIRETSQYFEAGFSAQGGED